MITNVLILTNAKRRFALTMPYVPILKVDLIAPAQRHANDTIKTSVVLVRGFKCPKSKELMHHCRYCCCFQTDIDECKETPNLCVGNAQCVSLPNGYKCTCKEGFNYTATGCVDINECASSTPPCRDNSTCANEPGSFR